MVLKYSTSRNDLNNYKAKETEDIKVLFTDLATKCVTPITDFSDKEMVNIETGEVWFSKSHRSNANIKERGNIAIIDFEGSNEKFKELRTKLDGKNLYYLAVPSQSNKSDKKNERYHIVYVLTEPYSINAEAMKIQAKEFFTYIGYKWDEKDSGIDTRATFNASGYFSPTKPLNDKKSKGNKKITDPYIDLDDVYKDSFESNHKGLYTPSTPTDLDANEEFTMSTVRGKRVREVYTNIIRTTKKGYVLSSDSHIMSGAANKFVTFETLVDKLAEIEGDNPRISGLGCPICNPEHTELKPGYAYMQYDNNDKPYICCTGNACEQRPYFTMADGNIAIHRVDNADGSNKYIMLENDQIIYTHERDRNFKYNASAIADELYNKGQYERDEHGNYSPGLTIAKYVTGCESIQINHNPFADEGLNIYDKTYNISPPARFKPTPEEPNDIISEAIKAFEDDIIINGYPISLIYLAYYLFHHKQIMAVLFLVNSHRGSGKSFWVLDLPIWYLGYDKVSGMGSAAIIAGWDDDKYGKRLVVYEDVEELNQRELGILRGEIKSDATAGASKTLNIKGQAKKRSFGFNSAGTTNHLSQIPFDGGGDRRIYPTPYKKLDNSHELAKELRIGARNEVKNRTNAINYLYKIYIDCEKANTAELHEVLYYKVPISKIKDIVEDSTSTDSNVAINIIKRSKSTRAAIKKLVHIVHTDVDIDDLKDLLSEIEFKSDCIKIHASTLKSLWEMLPSGKNSIKSYNNRQIIRIFNIEEQLKNVRIGNNVKSGIVIKR